MAPEVVPTEFNLQQLAAYVVFIISLSSLESYLRLAPVRFYTQNKADVTRPFYFVF